MKNGTPGIGAGGMTSGGSGMGHMTGSHGQQSQQGSNMPGVKRYIFGNTHTDGFGVGGNYANYNERSSQQNHPNSSKGTRDHVSVLSISKPNSSR